MKDCGRAISIYTCSYKSVTYGVETETGSERISRLILKFTAICGVTKERVALDLKNHNHQNEKLITY